MTHIYFMPYVYILYSEKVDKFYIGSCLNLEQRLKQHNEHVFKGAFTNISNDWNVYYSIVTENEQISRAIEKHIKRMKSRNYLQNLKLYPAMAKKLLVKYSL